MNEVPDFLPGFTFYGTCQCNGTKNVKYKRGEIIVYLTRTKFKVKKNGLTIKGYDDINQAKTYLSRAFPFIYD